MSSRPALKFRPKLRTEQSSHSRHKCLPQWLSMMSQLGHGRSDIVEELVWPS
ncbi:hypothetical protein NPIL_285921, partial [Nephila pilipes]